MSGSEIKFVTVKSRFARMAVRDGGPAAEEAIAAATEFVESQRNAYFDWVAEDLQMLEADVSALNACHGMDAGRHDSAYYKSAQIRDLGGTFGYSIITETADSLCELLYRLRSARHYSHDAVTTHIQALKMVCARDVDSMPDAARDALLHGLHRVVDKFPRPAPPEGSSSTPEA